MKRLVLAAVAALSALFAMPALAADTVVYAPAGNSTWTAVARDMSRSDCPKFGESAASYTWGSYPPGAEASGWLHMPSATAWGQYCSAALVAGVGLSVHVAGDGKSFGPPAGYVIARLGGPGQFELLVKEGAYREEAMAVLKARAAAKGGQVGNYVTTFVPLP